VSKSSNFSTRKPKNGVKTQIWRPPDSAFVAQRHQGIIQKRKSVFYLGGAGADTFDKLFVVDLGRNRTPAVLQKIEKAQK
jgi:hypothetical protein